MFQGVLNSHGHILLTRNVFIESLTNLEEVVEDFIFSYGCEQSVYVLSLACHYISPQEKYNNLYMLYIVQGFS